MIPRTSFIAVVSAAMLLMGAGCQPTGNEQALSIGDAYGQSALQAPNADGVRANAQAFQAEQRQPANTTDENGNAQATVPQTPPDTGERPNTPSPSMNRPTSFPGILSPDALANKQIRIETVKGTIVFDIYGEAGPRAASNFIALTQSGFYDGLTFHRVEPGFVIQGGDPEGTGRGGPGYRFEDDKVPAGMKYDAGIVAMANAGPNTNGSQFFIMLEDNAGLPPNYSIFGKVTEGMDVVRSIAKGDKMTKVTVEAK